MSAGDDGSGGDDGDDDDGLADDVEVFFFPVFLHLTVLSSTDLDVVGDGDSAVVFFFFFLFTVSFSLSVSSTTAAAADDDDNFLRFTLHLVSSLVPEGSDLLPCPAVLLRFRRLRPTFLASSSATSEAFVFTADTQFTQTTLLR